MILSTDRLKNYDLEIEEAQQQFPEIINASGATPQLIYQRDRPFVVVVRADLFQEFLT